MHEQRAALLAAAAVGMLSTLLPWLYLPVVGAVLGTAGDGWITLFLFRFCAGVAGYGDRAAPLLRGRLVAAVLPAMVASLLGVWKILQVQNQKSSFGAENPFAELMAQTIQVGPGLYLLAIAGPAALVAGMRLRAAPAAQQADRPAA